jgi:anti-sigma regulatory factor (Ser/Thr protein kinase)
MKSSLRMAAELDNLAEIRHFVQKTATTFGVDPDIISDVLLAVDEAVTNVLVHGYQGQPGMIELELRRRGDSLVVCLRDQAIPFDPTTVPPPDLTLPLEQRPFGGMGIYLMRQLMDEMTHRITRQGGNELTLVKKGVV